MLKFVKENRFQRFETKVTRVQKEKEIRVPKEQESRLQRFEKKMADVVEEQESRFQRLKQQLRRLHYQQSEPIFLNDIRNIPPCRDLNPLFSQLQLLIQSPIQHRNEQARDEDIGELTIKRKSSKEDEKSDK